MFCPLLFIFQVAMYDLCSARPSFRKTNCKLKRQLGFRCDLEFAMINTKRSEVEFDFHFTGDDVRMLVTRFKG